MNSMAGPCGACLIHASHDDSAAIFEIAGQKTAEAYGPQASTNRPTAGTQTLLGRPAEPRQP
jgi:hypothetical protein